MNTIGAHNYIGKLTTNVDGVDIDIIALKLLEPGGLYRYMAKINGKLYDALTTNCPDDVYKILQTEIYQFCTNISSFGFNDELTENYIEFTKDNNNFFIMAELNTSYENYHLYVSIYDEFVN